ncbi:N-formylglutamate amidohydrolase [Novosphingobium sp. ST904]|uniref:N-formylglutamate amidohydrolase n=1 Tax=Novosphingobium sp. ST904 TaxID=1684385 RepID=UPI0006C8C693|nr:N-formylglutamate amidohydrolase [Novosphingobium sp. ST904]KPH59342.1 N-formylglutamate amidohydrolase [Novosphingobium sp. ST904]TCM40637.1 putative N-formylglutamate amidohydrolase [Novosphingobium sp. ST904]
MKTELYKLLGKPVEGGIVVIADHASNHVPDGIDLGIPADLMNQHIAIDIGVAAVAERMTGAGTSAWLAGISRLVCDLNRDIGMPGMFPVVSDGYAIPGNMIGDDGRAARVAEYFAPYHTALEEMLESAEPALIVSLHSFTPGLATCDKPRPWEIGILYNQDDRAARIAIALLEAEGLTVGDQEPYSGRILNASMNRHAEAHGRPYLSIEIRQDQIADEAGQALWAERMTRLCAGVVERL